MKKHCDHDHIGAVPVRVPSYLFYPLPEVKIKPDPDTDTEVGEGDKECENVDDEKHVLELLDLCIDGIDIIIPNCIIPHIFYLDHYDTL